ncbi:cupin domain-containing protein [Dactylosporangium sp. CA-092794]|uniref:cupin domain-containing protein n=1 Tax=Dactylosporangium sp. CA-092794 TaxID=3239929 RepID=UPI003D8D8E81
MPFREGFPVPTKRFSADEPELDTLYAELAENDLQPLWMLRGLLTAEPVVATRPHVWPAATLTRLARRSGTLVGIDRGGDRRVLACANPGLGGAPYASSTMWAAVQYLGPGELAPAHRHTPAALRFVLSGSGVFTLVDGDPLYMSRGDLVLTPSMTFHEHHNPGDEPMTWMDVLDLPVVAGLDAVFFEEGPSETVEARTDPRSRSEVLYGGGPGLVARRPGEAVAERRYSRLLAYRWADTDRALEALLDGERISSGTVRYVDPVSGKDVMPTLRCEMTRVRPGARTAPGRQTGSRVGTVLNGDGVVHIGDETFEVGPGDIFVVPSWAEFCLTAGAQLDAFTTSDAPVLDALGLYRERAA